MRRPAVWLVLLVLAACGSNSPADSPDAVCRRQAYDDPAVKHLTIATLQNASPSGQVVSDYNQALRDATQACLRQKGIQVRGGVELVRPR